MAVIIKHKNITIANLVAGAFGSPIPAAGLILWDRAVFLTDSGHTLEITPTKIFILDKSGKIASGIDLKMGAVSLAMKGKLGASALAVVRSKIRSLVIGVYTGSKKVKTAGISAPTLTIESDDLVVVGNDGYVVTSIQTPLVDLKKATQLHQPVKGTSNTSRYHVVALSSDIKVAVRIKNDFEIAIRAVCMHAPQSKKGKVAKKALLGAGLCKKTGGHYSLHLEPETLDMAVRSIGSTLFSIDSFPQMSGNLKILVGVGS